MNKKYKTNPEVIATCHTISNSGEDTHIGDRVTGIQVIQDGKNQDGLVQIDVRDLKSKVNLIIEIELPELMAAISLATLNAERDK